MKFFKSVAQALSAIIYTPIYTGLMYVVIVFPTVWIVSLSFWKMIAAALILGGIIEGVVIFLQVFGLLPFAWIIKNNKVSFWISFLLCIILPICNIVSLWKILLGHGNIGVYLAIFLSLLLLQFLVVSASSLWGIREDDI